MRGRVNVSDQHRPQHPPLVEYYDICFYRCGVFLVPTELEGEKSSR